MANNPIAQNGQSTAHLESWSVLDKTLPSIAQVNAIHIYDFDNTLFKSPSPNMQIWSTPTINQLQNLHGGGWWADVGILESVGQGIAIEEQRAWQGCWNESIADLVNLSSSQDGVLTVLLTGRKQSLFGNLVTRMVNAKALDFDMVCLKSDVGIPGRDYSSTLKYKQALLLDLVNTYHLATEIKMYEDRPKHTRAFQQCFDTLNDERGQPGQLPQEFTANVVQVTELTDTLDPVVEVAQVQRMVNTHNTAILDTTAPEYLQPLIIKRKVLVTGHLISSTDSKRLLKLISPRPRDQDIRRLADSIVISPGPCSDAVLQRAGGMGHAVRWRVNGLAQVDRKLWVARVEPVDHSIKHYTDSTPSRVVLALRRHVKPHEASRITNWQSVSTAQALEFETTVGEKATLQVEQDVSDDFNDNTAHVNGIIRRKRSISPNGTSAQSRSAKTTRAPHEQNTSRDHVTTNFRGRDRNPSGRGRGTQARRNDYGRHRDNAQRNNNNAQRGRNRSNRYKSLDDDIGYGNAGQGMQY